MKNSSSRIPLIILAAVVVLVLISLGQRGESPSGSGAARESYYWTDLIISAPVNFIGGIWDTYISNINASQENERLRGELAASRVRCMTLEEVRDENRRLRSMLDFKKIFREYGLIPASLLTQDITLVFKSATIDRGSRAGFYKDMPIVSPEGVLGRVIAVSPNTSQVLLVTDPNSAIPAMIESSRIKGIVKGSGKGYLTLEYVRRSEELKEGDSVVTSGLLGIFPKGLRIGQVERISRDEGNIFAVISLNPYVQMDRIEEVFGVVYDASANR